MKILPHDLTPDDIERWIDRSDSDPRNWSAKPGAPERVVKALPEYAETYLASDNVFVDPDEQ